MEEQEENFRLSISNLAYSEPGSAFPDCREGLTDRLSSSVLLPGIEPRTGRKRDAAITTELEEEKQQQQVEHTCWKLVALQGLLTEIEPTQGQSAKSSS